MNKYQQFAKKIEVQEGEIILTHGVRFLNDEDVKPNKCYRNRPFLVLKKLNNGHILGLNITSHYHNLASQFRLNTENYEDNNILTKKSYATCTKVYEIDDSNISSNGFRVSYQEYMRVLNNVIRMYCVGFDIAEEYQLQALYKKYINKKIVTLGCVIKVPHCEDYLFVYDMSDKFYTCLPLHKEVTEDTQDAIQVLRGNSYVNYEEKYYVQKDDLIYIERIGDPKSPLIEQIKHPEEALELSLYYIKK